MGCLFYTFTKSIDLSIIVPTIVPTLLCAMNTCSRANIIVFCSNRNCRKLVVLAIFRQAERHLCTTGLGLKARDVLVTWYSLLMLDSSLLVHSIYVHFIFVEESFWHLARSKLETTVSHQIPPYYRHTL